MGRLKDVFGRSRVSVYGRKWVDSGRKPTVIRRKVKSAAKSEAGKVATGERALVLLSDDHGYALVPSSKGGIERVELSHGDLFTSCPFKWARREIIAAWRENAVVVVDLTKGD